MAAALFSEVAVLMPLQRLNERGEKGHESFGADAIGGVPDQKERMLDIWPVAARALARRGGLLHLGMVEEPHGVLTIIASRSSKGIQQLAFLLN